MKRRKSKLPPGSFFVAQEQMRPVFKDSGGNAHERAAEAFYALIEVSCPKVKQREYTSNATDGCPLVPQIGTFYPRGSFAPIFIAPQSVREAFSKLFLSVQSAIEAAHLLGIERGKSLLVQMAKGDITIPQFDKNVAHDPYLCATCGDTISNQCPRCQQSWES